MIKINTWEKTWDYEKVKNIEVCGNLWPNNVAVDNHWKMKGTYKEHYVPHQILILPKYFLKSLSPKS